MNTLEIFLTAVGLAMDAFAVSIVLGLSREKLKLKEIMTPGLYFGFFQAFMPFTGYFAGTYFSNKIESIDHWIAFGLLAFIGGKMMKDGLSRKKPSGAPGVESARGIGGKNPFAFTKMLVLAVATSIDALAVGVTFAFLKVNIYKAILITGVSTFVIAICGVLTGNRFGLKFKQKSEILGGAALIAIGLKIALSA
ncbi:MAG: manganese efflux pump MntP family protein [Spirochaetaceae bacterium]|nr:manganese efflux pump MntP family protein [Spirochaetaceae bacterium]